MHDAAGRAASPLAIVDLDARDLQVPPADGQLVIGVTRRPRPALPGYVLDALDLILVPGALDDVTVPRRYVAVPDPAAEAAALSDVISRFPQASLVLGQVLRVTQGMAVPAALDVESLAYSALLGGAEFRRWRAGRADQPEPGATAEPVLVSRDGDELTITVNRPDRRNAYSRQLRDALAGALRDALADASLRVVLNANGVDFCSGPELAELGTAPDPVTEHVSRTRGDPARLLHELRDRVEVRAHGGCAGPGAELSAFAGKVIAPETTWFSLPEISIGLIPGAGGTVSIPRRTGRWRALYLALIGARADDLASRAVNAATAHAWGLVDVAFPIRNPFMVAPLPPPPPPPPPPR